jgi:hypothetical protein
MHFLRGDGELIYIYKKETLSISLYLDLERGVLRI